MAEESQSTLGKTLSRLFSSNVVVRNLGDKKLKIVDPSNIQSVASKYLQTKYKGLHSQQGMGGTGRHTSHGAQVPGASTGYLTSRIGLYRDYDSMDTDAIISAALDMYADEAVAENEYGDVLTVNAADQEVKDILENLYYDILDIEFNMRWWVRSLAKYGDCYLKLGISEDYGIINAQPMSPYETTRVEGDDEDDPYAVKFKYEGFSDQPEFEFWEVAHFRLVADGNYLPYGKSILEGARRTWKQLTLMEDAMLIHRIMRAPEKRIFRVDVGNIEPDAVDTFMEQIIQEIKKTPLIDPQTGEYNLKYNMMNMIEDYYLPVRGNDSGTEIDTLSGLEYNAIEDIEYLRKKMMTSLRIPNAFLGYEEELEGKATLAQQSIKFANQISYIQKILVSELQKIGMIHLVSLGIRDERLVDFELSLTNPSTVRESEYLDLLSKKVDLARTIEEMSLFSSDWIFKKIFHLSDDEIERERELKVDDFKRAFRRDQIEREGNDPVKTGQSFGTPHDLAMSGSANIKPLSIEKKDKENKKKDAVKKMQQNRGRSNAGKVDGDPLGKEKAFDPSVLRGEDPDYEELYRNRRGLSVDNYSPLLSKQRELIHESLDSVAGPNDKPKQDPDHTKLDDTFMDESVLDMGIDLKDDK